MTHFFDLDLSRLDRGGQPSDQERLRLTNKQWASLTRQIQAHRGCMEKGGTLSDHLTVEAIANRFEISEADVLGLLGSVPCEGSDDG